MSVIKQYKILIKDITDSTKGVCRPPSPTIEQAKLEVVASKINNFDHLSTMAEFIHLNRSICDLTELDPKSLRALAVKKLKVELKNLAFTQPEVLLDAFTSLSRRYFLLSEMDRMLESLRHHPRRAQMRSEIGLVYAGLHLDDRELKQFATHLKPANPKEYTFETTTREYWLGIMTEIGLQYLETQDLNDDEKVEIVSKEGHLTLDAALKCTAAIEAVEKALAMKLSDLFRKSLFQYINTAMVLLADQQYQDMRESIINLPNNYPQVARDLAITKLKADFHFLTRHRGNALTVAYENLYRRHSLFLELDRMRVLLENHPRTEVRSFSFLQAYFTLSTDDDVLLNTYREKLNATDTYLFETVVREFCLEIRADVFVNHLSAETKMSLYRYWDVLGQGIKNNSNYHHAVAKLEMTLEINLNAAERKAVLDYVFHAGKKLIHYDLYKLEEAIYVLLKLSELMSRADAINKLVDTLEKIYDQENCLDKVYEAYSKEYDSFLRLENAISKFMGVVKYSRSPRPLLPLEKAMSRAYDTYSITGDVEAALSMMKEAVGEVRTATYMDHVTNGTLSGLGFLQPPSRLVVAIDWSLDLAMVESQVKPQGLRLV